MGSRDADHATTRVVGALGDHLGASKTLASRAHEPPVRIGLLQACAAEGASQTATLDAELLGWENDARRRVRGRHDFGGVIVGRRAAWTVNQPQEPERVVGAAHSDAVGVSYLFDAAETVVELYAGL